MAHHFTISELGLRLIKTYEGYRAQSREMISGEHVIGFGHRLADQDIILLTPEEADVLLRKDMELVEELVNETIFAPLTQGQFDALCSLAYNIGRDAFLKSDVIKSINNGRPIDAADGFDVWRKGEIHGEVLVVDALVRRRTAEKALFLKPEKTPVTSPRDNLPPIADDQLSTALSKPSSVFSKEDAGEHTDEHTGPVPYEMPPRKSRRREDGPAGVLELSEYVDEDNSQDLIDDFGFQPVIEDEFRDDEPKPQGDETSPEGLSENPSENLSETPSESPRAALNSDAEMILSPIAEAAAEVSTRLDALIDDFDGEKPDLSDMPSALIDAPDSDDIDINPVILPFKRGDGSDDINSLINEDLANEDIAQSPQAQPIDNESAAIDGAQDEMAVKPMTGLSSKPATGGSLMAYIIMLLSGVGMFGLSFYTWLNDPVAMLGAIGPIAALSGIIMGGVVIFASMWYILKSGMNKNI